MNAQRWFNLERARAAYQQQSPTVAAWPHEAILEISARCNLRCQMCAINYDTRHRNGSGRPATFEPALFERLRPLFPTLLRAHLYGLGEPVLNPHLADYIRALSAAGIETWFTTNATLIDEAKARELAEAGASRISVSIDGATAETYETIRRGARFASMLRGLHALTAMRRTLGRPQVTVNFVAMDCNLHELPALVDLCAEAGVEAINVEPLFDWGDQSAELAVHYQREALGSMAEAAGTDLLATARERAGEAGIHFSSRFLSDSGTLDYRERVRRRRAGDGWLCSEPWSTVFITAAGEVRTCCLNDTVFGNLFEQSFEEIWNGEPYRRFRTEHTLPDGKPRGCGSCRANGRQRHSPMLAALEPVSYRPLLPLAGAEPAPAPWHLEWPLDGQSVTDPLIVVGRRAPGRRWPWSNGAAGVRLMIDHTPVHDLAEAVVDGDRFVAFVPAPYLTEGAHVLSLQHGDGTGLGWDRRTIQVWRPPLDAAAASEGEPLCATRWTAALRPLGRRVRSARIRVDHRPWEAANWLCGKTRYGWVGAALLDLEALPPGRHRLEIAPEGEPVVVHPLERLAEAASLDGR